MFKSKLKVLNMLFDLDKAILNKKDELHYRWEQSKSLPRKRKKQERKDIIESFGVLNAYKPVMLNN